MYNRPIVPGLSTSTALAFTGFRTAAIVMVALSFILGGLILLRMRTLADRRAKAST